LAGQAPKILAFDWLSARARHLHFVSVLKRTADFELDFELFNTSSKKAISVQPCTRTRTKENNSEINLRRLALGGQTVREKLAFTCVQI